MNMDLVARVADAYLQTAEGPDAARLRFFEGLWDVQSGIEAKDRPYQAADAAAAREALLSGKPLFLLSAPEVRLAEYEDAVSRIAVYASDMAGLPAEQAEALRDADFSAAIGEKRLAGAVHSAETFVEAVAADMGAQPDGPLTPATVAFVLISALVPFLIGPSRSAINALGDADLSVWTMGTCPVCGTMASLGRMGEGSTAQGARRTLWCGQCHAEWDYERIRCVRCGCRDAGKFHYSHVEGDPAHRVHLCDECHGYTRFVFINDLDKPVSMVVEDVVSVFLDAAAQEQGYTTSGDGSAVSC